MLIPNEACIKTGRRLDSVAEWLSVPGWIEFDKFAIWFYLICLAIFAAASIADLNGSSMAAYPAIYGRGSRPALIVGTPKGIRSDEWAAETPAILNQVFRKDPLSAQKSALGGHSVALIGNLPVRHFSTVFRPQFWGFFILPPDYAFAVYWQFKALVLLTGVFSLVLLLSGSSLWAAVGSIWYFFSPYTQWVYTSPNPVPEAVGLACFSVVFGCLLLRAQTYRQLLAAVAGFSISAVDFALICYVPMLVPLLWVAILSFGGWCYYNRKLLFPAPLNGKRLAAVCLAGLLITAALFSFLHDTQSAIVAIQRTVYPGSRVFSGANTPIQFYFSHFFELTESQQHFPSSLLNICEAAGFLWIAPAILFFWPKMQSRKVTIAFLFGSFFLLLAWSVLPFPTLVGKFLALDRTWGSRCLPALGLANTAIVCVFVASFRKYDRSPPARISLSLIGIFSALFAYLLLADGSYARFFSWWEVVIATGFTAAIILCVKEGYKLPLALLLIVPHVTLWGLVNPIERSAGVFTSSHLFRFVQSHKELLAGKWLVFTDSFEAPGFLKATGCDVYDGERYQPEIDDFGLFRAAGFKTANLNRLGYLLAQPIQPGVQRSIQVDPRIGVIINWKVSPFDPLLPKLGIKYLAFDRKPPTNVSSRLLPLANGPLDGLWLYQLQMP